MSHVWQLKDQPNCFIGNNADLNSFADRATKNGAEQVIVRGEEAVVVTNSEEAPVMPGCVLPCECETKQVDNQEIDDNAAPVMPPCINAVSNEDSSDAINKAGRTGGGHVDMGQQGIDEKGKRVEETESISQPPSVIG